MNSTPCLGVLQLARASWSTVVSISFHWSCWLALRFTRHPQRPFTEWLPSAFLYFFSPSFIPTRLPPQLFFSPHKIQPRATSSPFISSPILFRLVLHFSKCLPELNANWHRITLHKVYTWRSFQCLSLLLICYKNWKFAKKVKTCCWVIPRRLNFICRRFGTPCLFHLHRQLGVKNDWVWECWCIYMGKGLARKNILTCSIPWLTPIRAISPSHTCPWPPCVLLPSTTCFCALTRHYPVTVLPIGSG